MKKDTPLGIKIFGRLVMIEGIIVLLFPILYGISQIKKSPAVRNSDFAIFSFFIGPLIPFLLLSYFGWRILSLKKRAWRESIFLIILSMLFGVIGITDPVISGKLTGIIILAVYGYWFYYFQQPKIKEKFK